MTIEQLDELITARNYIQDAECGPYSINYYKGLLEKIKSHKEHGTKSVSCTIDFLKTYVFIDADILIKIYEDKIAEIEKTVAECKTLIERAHYEV